MEVTISFSNLLADKIGNHKTLNFPNEERITISEFINRVEKEEWASEVIENGHIKNPVILIIDNELIQVSNNDISEKYVSSNSQITFQIMFAGG